MGRVGRRVRKRNGGTQRTQQIKHRALYNPPLLLRVMLGHAQISGSIFHAPVIAHIPFCDCGEEGTFHFGGRWEEWVVDGWEVNSWVVGGGWVEECGECGKGWDESCGAFKEVTSRKEGREEWGEGAEGKSGVGGGRWEVLSLLGGSAAVVRVVFEDRFCPGCMLFV